MNFSPLSFVFNELQLYLYILTFITFYKHWNKMCNHILSNTQEKLYLYFLIYNIIIYTF